MSKRYRVYNSLKTPLEGSPLFFDCSNQTSAIKLVSYLNILEQRKKKKMCWVWA